MWRFIETDEDGAAWLESPDELTAWAEFEGVDDTGASRTFRLMLVTRGWIERQLAGVRESQSGPLLAWLPALVVLPNASGEKLRAYVDQAVRDRASSIFAAVVQ